MSKSRIVALGMAVAMVLANGPALGAADAAAGEQVFKKKCMSCHSVEAGKHKMGPSLLAIIGRTAGTVPGYHKYRGLKDSVIVWDADNLEKFLTNPKKFLGKKSSMIYRLKNAKQRAAVIEYIKTLK